MADVLVEITLETGDLIKKETFAHRHVYRENRSGKSPSPEMPEIAHKPQKGEGKAWDSFLSWPSGSQLCQLFDLRPLASRTVRQHISIVSATYFVMVCYSHLRKQIYFDS